MVNMDTFIFFLSFILFFNVSSAESVQDHTLETGPNHVSTDLYMFMLKRVERLENRYMEQQAEINTLRSELHTEKQRTSMLEGTVSWLTKIVGERKGSERREDRKEDNSKAWDPEPGQNVAAPSVKSQGNWIRREAPPSVVAFYATIWTSMLHQQAKKPIVFENIVTNIGNGYDNSTGVFTAPVKGVYVFSVTLMGFGSFETYAGLSLNGDWKASLYLYGHDMFFAVDGASAILELDAGDVVLIENQNDGGSADGQHHSVFSGFLLPTVDTFTDNLI